MGAFEGKYSGLQVVGIYKEDLKIDLIANPEKKIGDIDNSNVGISIGKGVANSLGINIDQNLRLISPDGLKTLFGTTPRIGDSLLNMYSRWVVTTLIGIEFTCRFWMLKCFLIKKIKLIKSMSLSKIQMQ